MEGTTQASEVVTHLQPIHAHEVSVLFMQKKKKHLPKLNYI